MGALYKFNQSEDFTTYLKSKMSCLINVEYFSGGFLTFLKKVSFAGFTAQNKIFTKEIIFKYPTSAPGCIDQSNKFGNIELRRLDEDLIKTFAKFTTIFVSDAPTKEFINNYVTSYTKVIDLEATTSTSEQE